jgi:hypothetical protein
VRRLSTTAAMLIAGVLALVLVAYVFLGGTARRADPAPHCATPQALDQIKAELFRRAGQVRGTTGSAFANVAPYSVVLARSRMVRRHDGGSGRVTCTGTLALELPPGVAVAGGRRSLAAQVSYGLEPAASGAPRLLRLAKAEPIVVPLATLFQTTGESGPTPPAPPLAAPVNQAPPEADRPALPKSELQQPKRNAAPTVTAPRKESPRKAAPEPSRVSPAAPPNAKPAPKPSAPVPPRPTARVSAAGPSFNCRYARTRGEVAVCGNVELASLDRQMSGQFFKALSAARPGQRAMLQRSRKRFLRYRDSCRSERCIANAYVERMREIGDIMAGGW